jgi:hypothetical protein
MIKDCPEGTIVSEIILSEIPEKGDLQVAASAVVSLLVLSRRDYVRRSQLTHGDSDLDSAKWTSVPYPELSETLIDH